MQNIDPWAPIIFKDNFTNIDVDSVIRKINPVFSIVPNAGAVQGAGISSVAYSKSTGDNPHNWEEFSEFRVWAQERVSEALSKWKMPNQPWNANLSWIIKHNHGGWTDEHNHPEAMWSCAYYLKAPENSGRFLVRDPMDYCWFNKRSLENCDSWYPIDLKTGDFLIFPSWLYHKTEKNMSNEAKWVMSINFEYRK